MKVCLKHKKKPVLIYSGCVGCEIQRLREEVEELKKQSVNNSPTTIGCLLCGATKDLLMNSIAGDTLNGLSFTCVNCKEKIIGKRVKIE